MTPQRDIPTTTARNGIARIIAAMAFVACLATGSLNANAASGVDLMVVFDESGSMLDGDFDWLKTTVAQLDTELQGSGINDNRYGLMSFGMFSALYGSSTSSTPVDHELYLGLSSIGDYVDRFDTIPNPGFGGDPTTRGDYEDGYAATDDAAMLFDRGDDIARVIVFITDEDRDKPETGGVDYDTLRNKLVDNDVILNSILRVDLLPDGFVEGDTQALALDADGTAYVRGEDPTTGFASTVDGDTADTTVADYVDLTFDVATAHGLGGSVFDIRGIRSDNADVVEALTRLFLDIKLQEIGPAPAPEIPAPSSVYTGLILMGYVVWRSRRRE